MIIARGMQAEILLACAFIRRFMANSVRRLPWRECSFVTLTAASLPEHTMLACSFLAAHPTLSQDQTDCRLRLKESILRCRTGQPSTMRPSRGTRLRPLLQSLLRPAGAPPLGTGARTGSRRSQKFLFYQTRRLRRPASTASAPWVRRQHHMLQRAQWTLFSRPASRHRALSSPAGNLLEPWDERDVEAGMARPPGGAGGGEREGRGVSGGEEGEGVLVIDGPCKGESTARTDIS